MRIYHAPAGEHLLNDLGEVLEVALALDAVPVRERLYDAVDLRAAERARAVAVLVRAPLHAVLAYLVHQRLLSENYIIINILLGLHSVHQ